MRNFSEKINCQIITGTEETLETIWLLRNHVMPEMTEPNSVCDLACSCSDILLPVVRKEFWDKQLVIAPGSQSSAGYLAWSAPRRPFETCQVPSVAVGIMVRFHGSISVPFFLVGRIGRSGGYDLLDAGCKIFAFLDQERAELFAYANADLKAFTTS